MKKIKVFVLLFIVVILLSGCMVESNITMDPYGKVKEELKIFDKISNLGDNKSEAESYISSVLDKYSMAFRARGYSKDIETKSDLSYAIITNTHDNINSYFEDTIFSQYVYEQMKWEETDEYYEIKNVTDHITYCGDCSDWPALDSVRVNITLPIPALESNADEINKNTYTWIYDKNSPADKSFYLKISKSELKENEKVYEDKVRRNKTIKNVSVIVIVSLVCIGILMFVIYMYKKAQKNKLDY